MCGGINELAVSLGAYEELGFSLQEKGSVGVGECSWGRKGIGCRSRCVGPLHGVVRVRGSATSLQVLLCVLILSNRG